MFNYFHAFFFLVSTTFSFKVHFYIHSFGCCISFVSPSHMSDQPNLKLSYSILFQLVNCWWNTNNSSDIFILIHLSILISPTLELYSILLSTPLHSKIYKMVSCFYNNSEKLTFSHIRIFRSHKIADATLYFIKQLLILCFTSIVKPLVPMIPLEFSSLSLVLHHLLFHYSSTTVYFYSSWIYSR